MVVGVGGSKKGREGRREEGRKERGGRRGKRWGARSR
jgi:hypothetical protein